MAKSSKIVTVRFYLRTAFKNGESLIVLQVSYSQKRFVKTTGQTIPPDLWDKKKQRAKRNYFNAVRLNGILDALESKVTELNQDATTQGAEPLTYIRDNWEGATGTGMASMTVMDVLQEYITTNTTKKAANTIKGYKTLLLTLQGFETYTGQQLSFDTTSSGSGGMGFDFLERFVNYLLDVCENNNNTIKRKVKELKSFLKYAAVKGLHRNYDFKLFQVDLKTVTQHIALTREEVFFLYNLDLSNYTRLGQVRDVFCFGCFTGLRYSDIQQVSGQQIREMVTGGKTVKYIRMVVQKTKSTLSVELCAQALAILEKYSYQLPSISNQRSNSYLKELGQFAANTQGGESFEEAVQKVSLKGSRRVETSCKKYELITTHTARRSCATVLFANGVPVETIQQILGHASPQQTRQYIKAIQDGIVTNLSDIWEV